MFASSAMRWARLVIAAASASACATAPPRTTVNAPVAPGDRLSDAPHIGAALKDEFGGAFLIGAALNENQFYERDARGASIVKSHFNAISPENVLKWESVHPSPGRYAFAAPDRFVEFGERNGMVITGHTLVWHQQTPRWVFEDAQGNAVSRDTLLGRLRDHIHTVVGRYRGRIRGWDVVNEAVDEDGTLRDTRWLRIIGPDYIAKAFQFTREADPQAELYYNDYSVENAPKRNGVVALVRQLQGEGVRVAAVGLQGHNKLAWPSLAQQDSTIAAFAALGVKVMITELDVDVLPPVVRGTSAEVTLRAENREELNPYVNGLPDSVQIALAKRYADLVGVYLKHRDVVTRVTFWGVTDGDSWLNGWPVRGRTSYPLLFDRRGLPKAAFDSVVQVARRSLIRQ
jgi:endo-1,4-beta-xylanase